MPHTPGPWDAIEKANFVAVYADGVMICDVMDMDAEEITDAVRANAKLIAAAPELLNALANITSRFEVSLERRDLALDSDLEAVEQARAAIAKATQKPL